MTSGRRSKASRFCLTFNLLLALGLASNHASGENSESVRGSVYLGIANEIQDAGDMIEVQHWVSSRLHRELDLAATDQLTVTSKSKPVGSGIIYRIQQQSAGIPVVNLESRLIVSKNGSIAYLLGRHKAFSSSYSAVPALQVSEIASFVQTTLSNLISHQLVFWLGESTLRLAYELDGTFGDQSVSYERVYVDANNGEILDRIPLVYSAVDRRIYDFSKACESARIRRPVRGGRSLGLLRTTLKRHLVRSERRRSTMHGGSEDVFAMLGDVHKFLEDTLEIDSYDNRGAPLQAVINVKFHGYDAWPQCVGNEYNAAWNDILELVILPAEITRFPETLGHEFAHAVIQSGSRLIYKNESGALNEAIADAIGISFRAWLKAGRTLTTTKSRDDWLLMSPDGPMRDMQNPQRVDDLPNHYRDYRYGGRGWDGVHTNSSIINQGFYLLAMGGRHPDNSAGPEVTGVGIAKAVKIFGLAAIAVLTPSSDFSDARIAFAHVAELLFGAKSLEWVATHTAMDAIGIPGYWQRPPIPPPVPTTDPPPPPEPTTGMDPKRNAPSSSNSSDDDGREPPVSPPEDKPEPTPPVVSDADLSTGSPPAPRVPSPPPPPAPAEPQTDEDPSSQPPTRPREDVSTAPEPASAGVAGSWPVLLALLAVLLVAAVLFRKAMTGRADANLLQQENPGSSEIPAVGSSQKVGSLMPLDGAEPIPLVRRILKSQEGLIIGRGRKLCHFNVSDPTVSRRHLRLRLKDRHVYIEDLHSTSGTQVDGTELEPFRPMRINSSQLIRMGEVTLQFRTDT